MIRRIYGNLRKVLPDRLKGELTRIILASGKKPFVKKDNLKRQEKFPSGYQGGLIVSADFELGWAWRYAKGFNKPYQTALKMAEQARQNFPFLIKIFENFNIPVTWATVGHLLLRQCKKGDHDWMRKISHFENKYWKFNIGNWFDCDPYSSWETSKAWYAPDLIEKILNSNVKHEIGCHTFTHIDFSDKNCLPGVAEDEIKACVNAAKGWNIKLKSLVFPGGTFGNIEVLKKYGILIYRKNIDFDLAYPFPDKWGILVTPTSAGFGSNNYGWSAEYCVKWFERYIDKAIQTGTICHLWFHPSLDQWTLRNVMPEVLEYASGRRDEGKLWMGTMGGVAEHVNKNET